MPDIGAGEHDARPEFAKALAPRRLEIDTATSTVELGEASGLTMRGGDVLELKWQLTRAGGCSFRVACRDGSTAVVLVDGVAVEPDAYGVCSFSGSVGEHVVSIACEGAGSATVDEFSCPRLGMMFIVW